MTSQRIQKLKQAVYPENLHLCIERARIWTATDKETQGEPTIMRRAKAIANVLDNIPIFIEDGELIVGTPASKPMGVEADPASSILTDEQLEGLLSEGWNMGEADVAELRAMNEYWRDKTAYSVAGRFYDDGRLWPFCQSGATIPRLSDKSQGLGAAFISNMGIQSALTVPLYERVLNQGLNRIIKEAEEELRTIRCFSTGWDEKVYFLQSVIIALKGIIRFANRHAILAAEMAAKEKDRRRKKELEKIAGICNRVPANRARGFWEAIQSFWFIFTAITGGVTSLGRFDQFMHPFYKKDIEQGKITDEEVLELLQCLRIKDMQVNVAFGYKDQREKWSGLAKWNNMTIGGQTRDGKDATNELTYAILEAAMRCRTPHYTITVRVHDGTPEPLMLKALELVRTGIGMPAFISDDSYIQFFLSHGVSLEDARDYAMAGCLDGQIPGKSRTVGIIPFCVTRVFEIFIHNGAEPETGNQIGPKMRDLESFETFDDLMRAWKEHFTHFMGLNAEYNNTYNAALAEVYRDPITSVLMADAIKEGRDYYHRTMPFENGGSILCVGIINVVDSLAAIKRLIFDEKKFTMKELKAALMANWQGNGYDEIRKMCLAAPKYGNDDDYVDSIAVDLFKFIADTAIKFEAYWCGEFVPSGVSITSHWPGGAVTGATPDGRYAGEVLADGSVSPMRGRDTRGPTAVIRSAGKLDHVPFQSTLLNMKFHPSALKSTEDLHKLSSMIRIYFAMHGKHVQFNVISKDTLSDAQKHPENYRDLVVRVAGYSAYFTTLNKPMQDEIIARTEHELA